MKGTGALVLYLDFDGVLHHENCLWHPRVGAYLSAPPEFKLFQHVGLLEQLLAPYPQVQLVLSTSWVRRYRVTRTAKNLGPRLRERVVGATFHSRMDEEVFADKPRGLQVWEDVQRRKPLDWLALDDVNEGWPEWCLDKYIQTHEHHGLGDPLVQADFKAKLQGMCK